MSYDYVFCKIYEDPIIFSAQIWAKLPRHAMLKNTSAARVWMLMV